MVLKRLNSSLCVRSLVLIYFHLCFLLLIWSCLNGFDLSLSSSVVRFPRLSVIFLGVISCFTSNVCSVLCHTVLFSVPFLPFVIFFAPPSFCLSALRYIFIYLYICSPTCFQIFVWLLSSLLFMVPFVMFCFIVCDPVSFCVLSFLAIKQIFC